MTAFSPMPLKKTDRAAIIPRLLLLAFAVLPRGLAAQVDYVVQISLDGLGGTYLQNYLSSAPAQFPNFVRLTDEGAWTLNARCDYDISETIPNHATMFTARQRQLEQCGAQCGCPTWTYSQRHRLQRRPFQSNRPDRDRRP